MHDAMDRCAHPDARLYDVFLSGQFQMTPGFSLAACNLSVGTIFPGGSLVEVVPLQTSTHPDVK